MRQPPHEYQLAEVLVGGDENPLFFARPGEQGFVGGAWIHVQGRHDIVPEIVQQRAQAPGRRTSVEQESHGSA